MTETTLRITRGDIAYDLNASAARRLVRCETPTRLGQHTFSTLVGGIPVVVIEPRAKAFDCLADGNEALLTPLEPPRAAIIVDVCGDMDLAIAADDISVRSEDQSAGHLIELETKN